MNSEGSKERIVTAIEDPDRNSYSLFIRSIPYKPSAHNGAKSTDGESG